MRAKVLGMRAVEPEVPQAERDRARQRSEAHWLLALCLLEPPDARPCLVLVGGLPGTGKSTLAAGLATRAGFHVISSDRMRKELAGLEPEVSAAAGFGEGIYTPSWNERTYEALFDDARRRLRRGGRVIIDASFREERRRAAFLELSDSLRVPGIFLLLQAPPERVHRRIEARTSGPSDADLSTYEAVAIRWQPPSSGTEALTRSVDTGQTAAWSIEQSLAHLEGIGVVGS